jgi:hypothetical protein
MMMPAKMPLVSASIVALTACQHTAPYGAESGAPEAEGRVVVHGVLRGPSAWFNAERVVGPTINMGRVADGRWVGWIGRVPLNLTVADGRVSSASLTMDIRELPDGVEINGLWADAYLRNSISIRVTPKELYVRERSVHAVWLEGTGEGSYGTGLYGNSVELKGAAAQLHPPQPQFALVLLAAF